jgi:autotransporter-associated beta strand protein
LNSATLTTNGAVFDPNGVAITVAQALQNAAGQAGRLTVSNSSVTEGRVTLAGNNSYTGDTIITKGRLAVTNGNAIADTGVVQLADANATALEVTTSETIGSLRGGGSTGGNVLISGGQTLTVAETGNQTFAGRITNAGNFAKTGAGTLVLSGNSGYTGTTTVSAGALIIDGNNSSATGILSVSPGATLGGSGTIGGATTISGIHSPGSSPGVQSFTNGLAYNAGSSVIWELGVNGIGTRGADFDGINVTGGTLSFDATTTIDLTFLSPVDWNNAFWSGSYSNSLGWLVYDAGNSISGFENLALSTTWLDSSGNNLTNVYSEAGFSLYHDVANNDIYLNYAVPEPSTYALLVLAGGALMAHVMRRRRQARVIQGTICFHRHHASLNPNRLHRIDQSP